MRHKRKLAELERRAGQFYATLRLPDGTEVRYTSEDALAAFDAVLEERGHWLISHLLRMETTEGLAGLIRALAASLDSVEEGGSCDGAKGPSQARSGPPTG